MMQRYLVLENMAEAREQLEAIEASLRINDYSEEELKVDLEHAYHHINYAWHIRNETNEVISSQHNENFAKWSQFPINEIEIYK